MGRAGGMVRRGGVAGGGQSEKSIRMGQGTEKIFSWKEPTGGKGAFTCISCTRAVLKKKAFTCGSCTGDVLEKILFL